MNFKIVIPTYNTEAWIQRCVVSLLNQTYKNFECVIINDASTDSTKEKIEELRKYLDNRFKIVHNDKNVKALKNIVDGFNYLDCKNDPESVLMVIDGDDFLYSEWSLDMVRQAYQQTNCLLSYGNWIGWPDGSSSNCRPIHPDVHKNRNYRELPFAFSHLRTWKSKLWYNIKDKDLRDDNGNYFESGWDVAFMLPMIEMAGERTMYIPNVLYCYNRINPISDDKIRQRQQVSIDRKIRSKEKYKLLEE
jgi:glycosyltransferase involved in cell wall biosynthesis